MQNTLRTFAGVVLAGLAMSLGWGIRGDYGHEAGAMIPGAMLGLSLCLASLLVVSLTPGSATATAGSAARADVAWRPRRTFWICLLLMPIVVYAVARLTVASQAGPPPGRQVRFSRTISPN